MNRNMRKCYSRLARLHVHVGRLEEELALTRFSPGFPDPTLCKGKGGCLGFPGSCLIAGGGGEVFFMEEQEMEQVATQSSYPVNYMGKENTRLIFPLTILLPILFPTYVICFSAPYLVFSFLPVCSCCLNCLPSSCIFSL